MKTEKLKQDYKTADIELILFGQSDIITASGTDYDSPTVDDESGRWSDP